MDDVKLEDLWNKLGDVPTDDDGNIEEDFHYWEKGTDREAIWHWFDEKHSKGVAWLMYGTETSN